MNGEKIDRVSGLGFRVTLENRTSVVDEMDAMD